MRKTSRPPEIQVLRYLFAFGFVVAVLLTMCVLLVVTQEEQFHADQKRISRFHLGSMILCNRIERYVREVEASPVTGKNRDEDADRELASVLHLVADDIEAIERLQAEFADTSMVPVTERLTRSGRNLSNTAVGSSAFGPALGDLRLRADQLARLHGVRQIQGRELQLRQSSRNAWQLAAFGAVAILIGPIVFWRIRLKIDAVVLARQQIELERTWLYEALDQSASEVFLFDPETLDVITASSAAVGNTFYSPDELRRRSLPDLVPQMRADEERLAPLLTGDLSRLMLDIEHRRADGTRYPVQALFQMIQWRGRATLLEVATDNSELEMTREQLRQAQKMEVVGQLFGGIAHDFNNLLTVILGNAEFLAQDIDSEELELIRQAAENAARLTRQLLQVSRKSIANPVVLDLNTVLGELSDLLRRVIKENVELRILPCRKPARIRADPGEVVQAIMNLCVNARDAMPTGGRLTVETTVQDLERVAAVGRGRETRRFVVLEVRDTGVGMDAETRTRAMEPFYTTKPPGEGTGLGLATVSGVAQKNDGFVDIDSELGRGTSVTFCLPWIRDEVESQPSVESTSSVASGEETILVAEDDKEIGMIVDRVLSEVGYRVMVAESPHRALQHWSECRGRIDLLVTDLVMPGMGGDELAARLRAQRPDLRVLFMSGYAPSAQQVRVAEDGFILRKPFAPKHLLERVRRLLDEPTPSART